MSTILTDVQDAPIRVTIVAQNYSPEPSGNAPYTTDLAEGLQQRGWKVDVVTGLPYYPTWSVFEGYDSKLRRESINDVEVVRARSYIPKVPSLLKRVLMEVSFGISSALKRWPKSDVIVLVSPSLFAVKIAQIKAKLSRPGTPVVVWVQDLYSKGASEANGVGSAGVGFVSLVESSVLASADRVIAIHDRFKENMVGSLNVERARVSVVRNWTHIKPVSVDRDFFRNKFGWSADEVVVLHAGNMGAKQGLENVVETAHLADREAAPVRFVLLGGGNQKDKLVALAGAARRIDFMDSLDDRDFQGAMAGADVLLVNESKGVKEMSVPSKLTSYFASRRPVLAATDHGSITSDEIALAGAGVRVDTDSPRQMLDQALAIGQDPERATELGRSGAEYQAVALDRENAIDRYASILIEVIGDNRVHKEHTTNPGTRND